jgi:hypothetical protein
MCKHVRACAPAGQTAAYCAAHKLDGMVNNRHRLCAHPGCTSHATFKQLGDTHPTFCGAHRQEGMVQVCGVRWAPLGFFPMLTVSPRPCSDMHAPLQEIRRFDAVWIVSACLPEHRSSCPSAYANVEGLWAVPALGS